MSIFSFYWTWNDFSDSSFICRTPSFTRCPWASACLSTARATPSGEICLPCRSLSVVPVFIVFLFFQRYLVEGIATHGLKG